MWYSQAPQRVLWLFPSLLACSQSYKTNVVLENKSRHQVGLEYFPKLYDLRSPYHTVQTFVVQKQSLTYYGLVRKNSDL